MRNTRTVAAVAAALAIGLTACSGETGDVSNDASTDPTTATTAPAEEQSSGIQPGSTELPAAVDVNELPIAGLSGVVLVQQSEAGDCSIMSYDGRLTLLGTFPAFTTGEPSLTSRCDDRSVYASDFATRVGEIDVAGDDHMAVQLIGQPETDVTPNGQNSDNPVIGPDDKIYFNDNGTPSVINLDGTGLEQRADNEYKPAWVGGKLVDTEFAGSAVSNPDGSLAVERVDDTTYRFGGIRNEWQGYGPEIENGTLVTVTEALAPLAWVGDDQFITSSYGQLFINTIDTAAGTVSTEVLVDLSATTPELVPAEQYVERVVVCEDDKTAYFTVSKGGTQALPEVQSALVGVNLADGTPTVWASVLEDVQFSTEVLACV